MADQRTYGFIGLGQMGGPMADNIAKAGLPVHVYDAAGTKDRAHEKAIAHDSLAGVLANADTVFLSLPDGPICTTVAKEIVQVNDRKTSVVIDLSTIGLAAAQDIDKIFTDAEITYIDAPVSGGRKGAIAGTIAIMAGGSKEQFDKIRPYLETISPNIFHCGDVGAGHTMKVVNNVTSASIRIATFEAVIMGMKNGLSLDTMIEVLSKGSGQSNASKISLARIRDHAPGTFAMDLMHKDVRLACQLGNDSGVPMMASNLTREFFQAGMQTLGPKASCDDIIKVLERNAGVSFTD